MSVIETVETVKHLSAAEKREVLARLWTEQARRQTGEIWRTVRFGEKLRVVAYAAEQEAYVEDLRAILQSGALARIENEKDGTYEIYGANRTFYVTMTIQREFVALLSSWSPENPPRELNLEGESSNGGTAR